MNEITEMSQSTSTLSTFQEIIITRFPNTMHLRSLTSFTERGSLAVVIDKEIRGNDKLDFMFQN